MYNTQDIKQLFINKYNNNEFRIIGNKVQQSKTIELQNIQFIADKPWIIREPNYGYAEREIEWYKKQSLNVNDIPGGAPKMWKTCATPDGFINSNYGWIIWSEDNYNQFENACNKLINDLHTRESVMIYTRPSIQKEYNKDGMHDFICTNYTQHFINADKEGNFTLKYIVYQRSCDSVFGFDNDILWHQYVQNAMIDYIAENTDNIIKLKPEPIECNMGSLHIYERHFKYLK